MQATLAILFLLTAITFTLQTWLLIRLARSILYIVQAALTERDNLLQMRKRGQQI